jgi:hypothetical protein
MNTNTTTRKNEPGRAEMLELVRQREAGKAVNPMRTGEVWLPTCLDPPV